MNNKKIVIHNINWQQDYEYWDQLIEIADEIFLEATEYKDARELIAKIKLGLNKL